MTYRELYESAINKLEKSEITLGEFERMIKPLNAEIATDINVGDKDTISRQAAIEALHTWFRNGFDEDRWWNSTHVLAVIEGLPPTPPAQPEIIRCKDCKHRWTHKCMDSMPIERCDLEQTFYDAEVDYCSLAERREVTT